MRNTFRSKGVNLLGLAVLALISVALHGATYWTDKPMDASCGHQGKCASCHEGSAPRTHTAEFVKSTHGHMARFDRQTCYGCHVEEGCTECHLKEPPEWHTEAFRHPDRGLAERDEHARLAASHAVNCLECHQHNQQQQCSTCHRPDEWQSLRPYLDETISTATSP